MSLQRGACFSPEEIEILRQALDSAWARMSLKEQSEYNRSGLAEHILKLAADGERDPVRLRDYALRKTRERAVWLDLAV
jgi:hypothetical protein